MERGVREGISRRIAGVGLAAAAGLGAAPAGPRRIVSLNPCLDALLVHLADRRQITGISRLSRDPQASTIAEVAATLPVTGETAEEVLLLRPDLVLASTHTAAATRRALQGLGVEVAAFGAPATVAESLAQVRTLAARVGRPSRGEALCARIEGALSAAATPGRRRPEMLVLLSGGLAAGPGSLPDDLLRRLGIVNAATRLGLSGWTPAPLEVLIAFPPEVLVRASGGSGADRPDRLTRHAALDRLGGRTLAAEIPERLLFCGGPSLIEAARRLAAIRDQALERRP
ncbi:MAG: ABC transporter substrate-binding protein [Phenylobacterium sp.]|uniref:ABC transporter substrate-binding protein n=1 Tax=Phenylobacterium sp. TaxID=1871053 RepID=UPI0025D28DAC|nr:ABC transporter substrate-binding protein [Phenylobacterium sp.]MCA4916653.1 ABC transporter substrate-binding protein [Phenylobacterium sp.]